MKPKLHIQQIVHSRLFILSLVRVLLNLRIVIIATCLLWWSCEVTEPDQRDEIPQGEWRMLGLENEKISAIGVDQDNENIIYAGSQRGLFKSTNGGASWDTLLTGTIVSDIDIHPSNRRIVYIITGGILKTTDGGMRWVRVDSGLHLNPEEGPWVLAIDPIHPDILYLGTGGVCGGDLYKSTNGGGTWQAIGNNILGNGVSALAIDPSNTNTLYAGTACTGSICKSTDGGKSWMYLDFPEVGIVYDLLVDPDNSASVYVGAWGYGFYYSTNGGDSWQSANLGLADTTSVRKIALSPAEQIYIAANDRRKGAVYGSAQDKIHWTMTGNQSFELGINTIVYKHDAILAGASGIYVFQIP